MVPMRDGESIPQGPRRICLDITSRDLPTGVAGATDAEYVPYHICPSKTVLHKIYHDRAHRSHLLLPVISE